MANFVTNAGGAAFGNPNLTRQGSNLGVQQAPDVNPTAPPPKADAAPKTNKKNIFTGLVEALNSFENSLVSAGTFEVANVYSIEFAPSDLATAKVIRPGKDKDTVPMASTSTAANQLDSDTQSMDTTARGLAFRAGTPIVQMIDQIMRNSSYISDQAVVKIDETTQKVIPQSPLGGMAWYKISVETSPIEPYDKKRLSYAYNIKYTISTYGINYMLSEYFPEGRFRGLHKSYNYWFTGQNTEILGFEQEYNKLYKQIISNPDVPISERLVSDSREIVSRSYQAASEQSSQNAKDKTNEIAANGADYLYSPADQGNIKLRIVGDPAWLQQGEVGEGINSKTFSFQPFNNDGTINFDASEITFDITWNSGVDYDLNIGLADVGTNNYKSNRSNGEAGQGRYNVTYRAVKCRSTFSHGRFEQELDGRLFQIPNPLTVKDTSRKTTTKPTGLSPTAAGGTFNNTGARLLQQKEAAAGFPYKEAPLTPVAATAREQAGEKLSIKALQPASSPKPATSDGQPLTFSQAVQQGKEQRLNGIINSPQKIVKDQ